MNTRSPYNDPQGYQPQGYIHEPPSDAPREKKQKKWSFGKTLAVGASGLVLGIILGTAIAGVDDDDQQQEAQRVESVVEQEPEVITEIEVPDTCIVALTHSDNAIDIYSQALTAASDGILAYSEGDYTTLDEKTAEIESMHGELTSTLTDYYWNRDDCQTHE